MSRPATSTRPRPKSVNLSSTTGSLSSTVTLKCESCGKKYEAKNSSGLHVCVACTERGGAPVQAKKAPTFSKPKSVICYVCGREFFQDSIKIHTPQCLKKRALAQSKLPLELRTTLVKPREQTEQKISTGGSRKTIDEQNEEAYEIYKSSLVPCDNCGRTFSSPDRLQVHLRSCRADAPSRAPPQRTSTSSARTSTPSSKDSGEISKKPQWKKDHEKFQQMLRAGKGGGNAPMVVEQLDDDVVPCPHCSRRFNETAAERHIPKCANVVNKPKPPPSRNSLSMTTPITQVASSSPSTSPNKRLSVSSASPTRPKSVSMSSGSPSASKGLPSISNTSPKEVNLFCGGCGTKYTSASSKFCGGCGRKR